MKANAPEKIYIPRLISDGKLIHEWDNVPFKKFRFFFDKEIAENIEYTRTDAFIEKAASWIENNLSKYSELTDEDEYGNKLKEPEMNVFYGHAVKDFRNYMKGE